MPRVVTSTGRSVRAHLPVLDQELRHQAPAQTGRAHCDKNPLRKRIPAAWLFSG